MAHFKEKWFWIRLAVFKYAFPSSVLCSLKCLNSRTHHAFLRFKQRYCGGLAFCLSFVHDYVTAKLLYIKTSFLEITETWNSIC